MPLFGPIKRTYSKKQNAAATTSGKENEGQQRLNVNSTLDDSLWKDSFDKLLNDKNVLREKKVIKKTINASYNRDSSKEGDLPELFIRRRGKRKTAVDKTKALRPPKVPKVSRKRKKATHIAIGDAVVSTPVGGKKAKKSENLSFNISPIGFGHHVRDNDNSLSQSQFLSPLWKKRVENRQFFNPKMIKKNSLIGEKRIEVNVDHNTIKELIKSFVQAVNTTNSQQNGKSVIELSHTTDDEVLAEVLKNTNPETLIQLALLPHNSVSEVLEQSMKNQSKCFESFAIQPSFSHVTHRKGSKNTTEMSNTSSFHGYNESGISNRPTLQFVTHRRTKSNEKRASEFQLPCNNESNTSDFLGFSNPEISLNNSSLIFLRDNRNDRTSLPILPSQEPDRITLNYLHKTLQIVEAELDASTVSNSEPDSANKSGIAVPIIHVEDSPRCIRNDVTRAIDYEPTQDVESKTGISDVSVIPATPIITRHRTTRPQPIPVVEPNAFDNISVIDCTPSETFNQRRFTRRLTRKNVQFTRPSLDKEMKKSPSRLRERKTVAFKAPSEYTEVPRVPPFSPRRLRERKTVAFDTPSDESQIMDMPHLHLAPGKWRKSLAAWKRKTLAHSINVTNENETKLSKADISTKKISGVRKSDGRWLSTNIGRMTIQEDVEEESEQELVLEPTTDETCNLSELSLRDSEAADSDQEQEKILENNNSNSAARIQRSNSYIDESRRHRSLYRRKLSALARKTSVYERTTFLSPTLSPYYSHPANDLRLILPKLTARDVVLRLCKQSQPLVFDEIYSAQALRCCRKIGEGVYSEVFMYKNQGRTIVLKVIPVEGDQLVNGEPQKRFDEIQSEIVIAQELSNLRSGSDNYMTDGFVEAVNVRCVQGRYPDHLIELWELYDENRTSDNDHPELFKDDQLFIVLELANGGQDLEAFQFDNAQQSHSAFLQVAITLAIAEKRLEFEHRDLHWGNVLLSNTEELRVTFKVDGKIIEIPTFGVKATIIDFTLSRMVANGVRLYNDLAQDDELFAASGDYQFDIYRFMKGRLDNCWERFEPYTNLFWLHYLVDKMINGARYKNSKSKKHRAAIDQLMQLRDELLDFKSAADYVECIYN